MSTEAISKLIQDLGGDSALSKRLGCTSENLWHWKKKGSIPYKWHLPLAEMARDLGLQYTVEGIARMRSA